MKDVYAAHMRCYITAKVLDTCVSQQLISTRTTLASAAHSAQHQPPQLLTTHASEPPVGTLVSQHVIDHVKLGYVYVAFSTQVK